MEKENTRFKVIWKSVIVPLNYKGYYVRANITRTTDKAEFEVTYEISCADCVRFDTIEGDTFTVHCDKDINWVVYHLTKDKFAEGYFKPFIDRYEFEMTALNKGIDMLEAERGCES